MKSRSSILGALLPLIPACSGSSKINHEAPARSEPVELGFHVIDPVPRQVAMARAGDGSAWTFALTVSEKEPALFGVSNWTADDGRLEQELIRWTPKSGTLGLGQLPGVGTGSGQFDIAAVSEDGTTLMAFWWQLDLLVPTNKLLRWTKATGVVELVAPVAVERFERVLLSEDGSVAVVEATFGGSPRAFRYTPAVGFESIGPIDGFDAVAPRYLSRDGRTLVGFASTGASCQDDCPDEAIAFRQTDGIVERLGSPEGTCTSGEVADTARGPILTTHCNGSPYLHEDGAGWTLLTGVPTSWSTFSGVSGDGASVFGLHTANGPYEAWRWQPGGGLVSLKTATVTLGLDAPLVSHDGTVATGMFHDGFGFDGFFWVEGAGVTVLPGIVPSSLSAAGDRIVGPDHDGPIDAAPFIIGHHGPSVPVADALVTASASPGAAILTHARITRGGELLYGGATLPDLGVRAWLARLPR